MSWLLNKYAMGLLLIAGVVSAGWWGYHTIDKAFTDRTQLRKKVKKVQKQADAARQERDAARRDARKSAQDLVDEIKLRESIAHVAEARQQEIQKELSNARQRLREWKDSASPDLARCLDVIVPAGAISVHERPEAAPAGASHSEGLHHPASTVHGDDPGAAASRSADIHTAPGPRDVPRLGPGAERKAQRYADVGQ